MLLFEPFRFTFFGIQIGVDLGLVGVVVGQGNMNLRQRHVPELRYDLFRNETHVVPHSYPANGNSGSRDTRPAAVKARPPGDQTADVGHGCHRLQV